MLVPGCECKDCDDRYPGCHDKCDRYAEYRKKVEKANKACAEATMTPRYTLTSAQYRELIHHYRRRRTR